MDEKYIELSKIMSALSSPKRLKIVDMLSCGELCGNMILEVIPITQPSLSYDMKILVSAGIVQERNEGKYVFYSICPDYYSTFTQKTKELFLPQQNCICKEYEDKVNACRRNIKVDKNS